MNAFFTLKSFLLVLVFPDIIMTWRDYEAVSILSYTRHTCQGDVDQGVVVLVNEAVFAYFNSSQKTFLLRPSATAGFSVLEASERMYCVSEVTKASFRQRDYLNKLTEESNKAQPPKLTPSVNMYSQFSGMPGNLHHLYCYATGFYPADIEIRFLLNGQPFPGPVETSDLVYGEDWSFRVFKHIQIHPHPGQLYACVVNHSSIAQPKIVIWRPEVGLQKNALTPVLVSSSVAAVFGFTCGCFLSIYIWKQCNNHHQR